MCVCGTLDIEHSERNLEQREKRKKNKRRHKQARVGSVCVVVSCLGQLLQVALYSGNDPLHGIFTLQGEKQARKQAETDEG